MRVRIDVELGNERMQTAMDVSAAVQDALGRYVQDNRDRGFDPLTTKDSGPVRDGNGNTVGSWSVHRSRGSS